MHFKPAGRCLNVKKWPVKGESKRREAGKGKNQTIVNRVVTLEQNTGNHILKPTPEWMGLKF